MHGVEVFALFGYGSGMEIPTLKKYIYNGITQLSEKNNIKLGETRERWF